LKRSHALENMFAPYGYEITKKFLEIFKIFFQVEGTGYIPKNSAIGLRYGGKEYSYAHEHTYYFQTEKNNPYGPRCAVITFHDTEEQIINKFERFIKMKAFL